MTCRKRMDVTETSSASSPSPLRRVPTCRVDSHKSPDGTRVPPTAPEPFSRPSDTLGPPPWECPKGACCRYPSRSRRGVRGAEVRARRHAIPDLIEVALQVLLECRQRLAIHARSPPIRFHPLIRIPHELLRNVEGFASDIGSSHCWLPYTLGQIVGLLRSVRIARRLRYYEPVRPCASHRYSIPHGATTWRSPFASRRQVPTFRTRACPGLTPSSCRSPLGQSAGSCRASSQAKRWSLTSAAHAGNATPSVLDDDAQLE